MIKFTINKIKNKKGFAMAELLAVCIVVLSIFTILFSNYLPLVAEYENRSVYNNVTAEYAAHHFRKMYADVSDTNFENFFKGTITSAGYATIYNSKDGTANYAYINENKAKKLIQEYQIEEIIITTYKLENLKAKYPKEGKLYNYINYLPTYANYEDNGKENYRIILKSSEFGYATTEIKYSDASNEQPANKPVLSANMIAVYYDYTNEVWKKADGTKDYWYNYSEFEKETEYGVLPAGAWANSVTVTSASRQTYLDAAEGTPIKMEDILTMQVWIPRYKYTVWNYNEGGQPNSENKEFSIKIEFESETTSDGKIVCESNIQGENGGSSETCKIKGTDNICTNAACNGLTYTHPAFTFGDEELPGFWVGKFELTGISSKITTKPGLNSLIDLQVGEFDNYIRGLSNNNNIYGFNTNVKTKEDLHMIKNMEWGAVAYLSHSKYGTTEKLGFNSYKYRKTGCGLQSDNEEVWGTSCNSYNTEEGQRASTTGNVYGVYDMSGGTWEYVMGVMLDSTSNYIMSGHYVNMSGEASKVGYSGYSGIIYDVDYVPYDKKVDNVLYNGTYTFPDLKEDNKYEEKYSDLYSYGTAPGAIIKSKLGDATKEIYESQDKGWDENNINMIYADVNNNGTVARPWIRRGGGTGLIVLEGPAGLFVSDSDSGGSNAYTSRLVIAVTDSH